jgi:hypothetical protein
LPPFVHGSRLFQWLADCCNWRGPAGTMVLLWPPGKEGAVDGRGELSHSSYLLYLTCGYWVQSTSILQAGRNGQRLSIRYGLQADFIPCSPLPTPRAPERAGTSHFPQPQLEATGLQHLREISLVSFVFLAITQHERKPADDPHRNYPTGAAVKARVRGCRFSVLLQNRFGDRRPQDPET